MIFIEQVCKSIGGAAFIDEIEYPSYWNHYESLGYNRAWTGIMAGLKGMFEVVFPATSRFMRFTEKEAIKTFPSISQADENLGLVGTSFLDLAPWGGIYWLISTHPELGGVSLRAATEADMLNLVTATLVSRLAANFVIHSSFDAINYLSNIDQTPISPRDDMYQRFGPLIG